MSGFGDLQYWENQTLPEIDDWIKAMVEEGEQNG